MQSKMMAPRSDQKPRVEMLRKFVAWPKSNISTKPYNEGVISMILDFFLNAIEAFGLLKV